MHGIREAAKLAGITEHLLELWLERGMVKATQEWVSAKVHVPGLNEELMAVSRYRFDDAAVEQIRQLAEASNATNVRREKFVDDGRAVLTVSQVADLWSVSDETITRIFAKDPDVIRFNRGKRSKRTMLRIPRTVMERAKRRLSKI